MTTRVGLVCLVLVSSAAACGGTSSETPWPVEPDTKALGPAQESGPAVVDTVEIPEERPDAGGPKKRTAPEAAGGEEPDIEP